MKRILPTLAILCATPAAALYLDDRETILVTGKVFTQASLRMEDSDSSGRNCFFLAEPGTRCSGFTFPTTKAGQLIQNRNLVDAEIFHDVHRWLDLGRNWVDTLSYRFRVKYYYEGVYDYGPKGYRDPSSHTLPDGSPDVDGQDGLRANRHVDTQHDPIWNAYIDAAKGPLWTRTGRQDLSWGETDGFRLLDMIEPLDNRFGFPLVEDLDDRRIPLWMVRSTLSLGTWGPASNFTLEGYWVPGSIDNQESPLPRTGNPFGPPAPPGQTQILIPNKKLSNSRGGGRILATLWDTATVSLAHYVTFNDLPSARLEVRALEPAPDIPVLLEYYQQQVTGISATMALPFDPYTIVRTEAANFWDERVFIPAASANAGELIPRFLAGDGSPVRGGLPTRNVVRWVLGVDRNVWLRWLNPENTFLISAQYFHTHIVDYDDDIVSPLVDHIDFPAAPGPPQTHFLRRKNDEVTLTYLVNTFLWHGRIMPQVFGAYETRGANAIVPSVTYQFGTNMQIALKYAVIFGKFAGLGVFRDRDQLLVRVQYNLS